MRQYVISRCVAAAVAGTVFAGEAAAMDFTIAGRMLTPTGVIADGAIAATGQTIGAVGPAASVPTAPNALRIPDTVILPGFIDLHYHLTWNILPRWVPGRKFASRLSLSQTQSD
jgi:5-methylthioadenosine/S-adenosylhomocysteine deaminase